MKPKDEWCDSQEIVEDDKTKRCSLCNKRLKPRETDEFNHLGVIYRLPPHKKKGYKIRRLKGHNKRNDSKRKNRIRKTPL